MTPPAPRPPRPKSASPAERSVEYADAQRQLKEDAARRRAEAEQKKTEERPKSARSGR